MKTDLRFDELTMLNLFKKSEKPASSF